MKRRLEMAIAALSVAGAGLPLAAADTEPGQRVELDKGMTELSLWGALDTDELDYAWLWFGGDVGFLVSPRHELGATVYLQYVVFDWATAVGGACGGFYRYNVPIGSRRVVPFIGARAVGYLGEYSEWDAELRAEAGIRHFTGNATAIDLTGYWGRRFGPDCEGAYCPDDSDRAGLSVGLSVFF
jgi:hypothetical protein